MHRYLNTDKTNEDEVDWKKLKDKQGVPQRKV